jgi:hypothetical protein
LVLVVLLAAGDHVISEFNIVRMSCLCSRMGLLGCAGVGRSVPVVVVVGVVRVAVMEVSINLFVIVVVVLFLFITTIIKGGFHVESTTNVERWGQHRDLF